ncbi:hypothetical protein [Candidatus Regiella endosymbiont of Tuberolachnus salignus]|uniref:hypothetical protein n=1 Tax=Candidatus Regiella endosymbiont of Tuberolachnus salignus TaxID=3077956 RepID=UPI0030CDCABF
MNFELRQGGKGDRPMSVDILRDSASTRRQQSRNLKGEGYKRRRIHFFSVSMENQGLQSRIFLARKRLVKANKLNNCAVLVALITFTGGFHVWLTSILPVLS